MIIHCYPNDLISHCQLADGTNITIRPIRPEDAEIERSFVRDLSSQSKYFRFMHALSELTPKMLERFTQIDYDREMALIAVVEVAGKEMEIGVARYAANPGGKSCEFAIVVADDWHKKGIASHLLSYLIQIAKDKGFKRMLGEVLASNSIMLELAQRYEFTITTCSDDRRVKIISKDL